MNKEMTVDLITTKAGVGSYYRNDLTHDMDKFTDNSGDIFYNYVYDNPQGNKWILRYPGATRGHLEVDENMKIVDIKIYRDVYNTDEIYKDGIYEMLNRYVGAKLVIEK